MFAIALSSSYPKPYYTPKPNLCRGNPFRPPPPSPPQMSHGSSQMPRAVEDMPEADLRELARWFKSKGGDRRRLLRRYKAGRQKTEALNARKQVTLALALV